MRQVSSMGVQQYETGITKKRLHALLDIYFSDIAATCPYQTEQRAVYRQALFAPLPDHIMEHFLEVGYRRNGNCIYTMCCPDCTACVPLRINPLEFKPNRNQRRVRQRNRDVEVRQGPLHMDRAGQALFDSFLRTRYAAAGGTAEEYYRHFFANTLTTTMEIRYIAAGKLIGISVVDFGVNWLNAVYFAFDPSEGERSPGTYNILHLIDFCRQHNITHLYLGYWIEEVAAMNYKTNFKPNWLRLNDQWCQQK
jgi:arginine-tRNA-protein transferase